MRLSEAIVSAIVVAASACDRAASPEEVVDRGWAAHALVVAAGEHAATCAEAGAAMRVVFERHRGAFVAAFELERDKARLAAATAYLEAHATQYADLETRTEALSARCGDDRGVSAVFAELELPEE